LRDFTSNELSRVKIHQPVWPVRESQKKRYKISPICPGAPSGCNHCCSRLMGFDSVRGQNSPSPIDLAGRRQHSAGATAQPVIRLLR